MKKLMIALIAICMSASVFAVKKEKPKPEELLLMIQTLQAQVVELQTQIEAIGPHYTDADAIAAVGPHSPDFSLLLDGSYRDDSSGYDTLVFSGMNVQLVNGTGSTDGTSADAEGTGNLIIGYNELRVETGANPPCPSSDPRCNYRLGSHNLIIGNRNNYTANSYGGMVVGRYNEIDGAYASVSGGAVNEASGDHSSVSGGLGNTASNDYSSVSGGSANTASNDYSSVSGGYLNTASGFIASVSGGYENTASYNYSSVSGGSYNTASGFMSSVSGGRRNEAFGWFTSVSGGYGRSATGDCAWAAASLYEDEQANATPCGYHP